MRIANVGSDDTHLVILIMAPGSFYFRLICHYPYRENSAQEVGVSTYRRLLNLVSSSFYLYLLIEGEAQQMISSHGFNEIYPSDQGIITNQVIWKTEICLGKIIKSK